MDSPARVTSRIAARFALRNAGALLPVETRHRFDFEVLPKSGMARPAPVSAQQAHCFGTGPVPVVADFGGARNLHVRKFLRQDEAKALLWLNLAGAGAYLSFHPRHG